MNELCREQHPLLCDDFSDDDLSTQNCSPRSNKRLRTIVYGGQTKNQMKGAAAIFKTWPEHWWSTLKYWWIGLGMTAIVILIVYNSVVAFSMLPMVYTKTLNYEDSSNNIENQLTEQLSTTDVYMHAFAESKDDIILNDFLPYIEIISKRYRNFNFHFIIVINETFKEREEMNDETKNLLALNALWTDDSFSNSKIIVDNNLVVSYVSINNYLTNPVLQEISKDFSKEFMEFLVRVLSIWEKGGIVFNPIILTPRSPNSSYIEKINHLLNNYLKVRHNKTIKMKENKRQSIKLHKTKKKLNNIRDIINALEEDEKLYSVSQHNLIETEDRINSVIVDADDNLELHKKGNASGHVSTFKTNIDKRGPSNVSFIEKNNTSHHFTKDRGNVIDNDKIRHIVTANSSRNSTQPGLLPLFLEYLYPKGELDAFREKESTLKSNHIHYDRDDHLSTDTKNKKQKRYSSHKTEKGLLDTEENSQVTIDLKGNIVASNTPCHAFVGNLLRNAAHHSEEESLTEFIIAELTVFCKGVLSSCKGIDVILL